VHSLRRVSVFSEASLYAFSAPCLCLLITITASLCSINAWCFLLQLQPWNLKAEKQETCLCKSCENFGLHEKGLNDVFKLLEEELKDGAVDVEAVPIDEHDEVLKLSSYRALHELTKMKRRIEKVESVLCPTAFESNCMGCIDPAGCKNIDSEDYVPFKECGFQQHWSGGLRQQLLDDDGDLLPDVHPVWLRDVSWSQYKTGTDADGKRTLREECTGSVIEFFDTLERVYNKYQYHRYILHRTRLSNLQFDRNAVPGMLKLDVDWAENFTMLHAREIQSEYWLLKQLSLFIGIGKLLFEQHWEAVSGALSIGDEVTVTSTNKGMFWAEIKSVGGALEDSLYVVEDEAGTEYVLRRSELRARVWYTVAQAGCTNDKKHDSYATQHFMDKFIDEWMSEHKITSIHIHSDNAGSHFKNSRTLNYLSRLHDRMQLLREKDEFGYAPAFQVTWSFGCPG
jgi:hypothetical protein